MSLRGLFARIGAREELNFLLTNRIPRRALTLFMGWFSRIERPWLRDLSIALWRQFTELDLSEATKTQAEFKSLHECFTRELKPGARRIATDPDLIASPCDGIVVACGRVEAGRLLQAKGMAYTLHDLLADPELEAIYAEGSFVTLRLTSAMYHRFHAPHDCTVERVTYISGDTWNVNPPALKRIERLYCRNERAVLRCRLDAGGQLLTLVPVAAVLVASIRLRFLDVLLHLRYRGPNVIACSAHMNKGEEMGWFEHGSTIIVFAPTGCRLHEGIETGTLVRMGQALLSMR